MRIKLIILLGLVQVSIANSYGYASLPGFQHREIADNVFAIQDTATGDEQVVIVSDKGLVVLNSFWSETTAQRFKAAISDALKRDDFLYLINTNDRLDVFGGNAAYGNIPIIGHRTFWDEYRGKEDEVRAEVTRLIEMWRFKAGVARERMANHEPGSEAAVGEQQWINTCDRRANDLESGFSLVLPTETYEDRKTLDLGNLTLDLVWFGREKRPDCN